MYKHFLKRLLDIVFSLLVFPLFGLILIPVAIAIKLDDGGPVFYKSAIVGKGFQKFNMLKFRSMKVNDVADSKQAMLMVLVKQNLGIYFFVLILINFPSLSMCLKVVC